MYLSRKKCLRYFLHAFAEVKGQEDRIVFHIIGPWCRTVEEIWKFLPFGSEVYLRSCVITMYILIFNEKGFYGRR